MNNKVTFDEVVSGKCKKLIIDCIYENKQRNKDLSCRVLSKLMKVQNTGGFRPIGEYKNDFSIKYVVLYSTGEDIYWQDDLDEVKEELADVINYCLLMADQLGVNPKQIVLDKMEKTA